MDGQFTVFEYMYRDAGNFKTVGRLLLSGRDPGAESAIRASLEWSDQFVAEQVGIPALCEEHWESVGEEPSDLDHAFHEFIRLLEPREDDLDRRVWGSLDLLVRRMQACAGKWNVSLSPNSEL